MNKEKLNTVFAYLDELRDSGDVNMLGATEKLIADFEMPEIEAKQFLQLWMDTFTLEDTLEQRVNKAIAAK